MCTERGQPKRKCISAAHSRTGVENLHTYEPIWSHYQPQMPTWCMIWYFLCWVSVLLWSDLSLPGSHSSPLERAHLLRHYNVEIFSFFIVQRRTWIFKWHKVSEETRGFQTLWELIKTLWLSLEIIKHTVHIEKMRRLGPGANGHDWKVTCLGVIWTKGRFVMVNTFCQPGGIYHHHESKYLSMSMSF